MKKVIAIILSLVLCFALAVGVLADHPVNKIPTDGIALDGVITEAEWGQPVFANLNKNTATDGSIDSVCTFWEFDTSYAGEESADIYITNDSVNIYVGMVMHNTTIDSTSDGTNLWQHENFTFTLSYSVEGTNVPHIDFDGKQWEQYTGYRIGMLGDGTTRCEALTQGLDPIDLYEGSDYVVKYDEANKTMTYEVAIPFSNGYTNMNIESTVYTSFSAVIPFNFDSNGVDGSVNGANRILIGTGAAFCGGAGNFAHAGQSAIVLLNDATSVAGIVPGVKEEAPEKEPEVETNSAEPVVEEVVTIEKVEKEIVFTPGVQLIIMIASAVVILASVAYIVITFCVKKKPCGNDEPKAEE